MSGLSPMMRHYLQIKDQYKDCVLFYRLGDFYEMFFDDAKEVSALLDLTLTGRDCGLEERAPMCGIPFHAADTYIARLVALGKKVAICEQLSDPATSKGMVDRDVVRVVSAGTLIEDELLDERSNNFIACAYKSGEEWRRRIHRYHDGGILRVLVFGRELRERGGRKPCQIIARRNYRQRRVFARGARLSRIEIQFAPFVFLLRSLGVHRAARPKTAFWNNFKRKRSRPSALRAKISRSPPAVRSSNICGKRRNTR